jgi:hypothetical protein
LGIALAFPCQAEAVSKEPNQANSLPGSSVAALSTHEPGNVEPTEIENESPGVRGLAATLCEVKRRIRWRTPAWQPEFCHTIAREVLKASTRYDVSPYLIVAIMLNESDLNEAAVSTTVKDGKAYARDGGLMGIRCVLGDKGRCKNGNVRGITWTQVMNPVTNIDLGAQALAYWRDTGGVAVETVRARDTSGRLLTRQKLVRCTHKDHAYWAHYNHGLRYIDHGRARYYPERIAILSYAFALAMNASPADLTAIRLAAHETADHLERRVKAPPGVRFQRFCEAIRNACPSIGKVATVQERERLTN